MAYWLSHQIGDKVNGTKWHVYDIPNGFTPPRAGNVILRTAAWGNRWVDSYIHHEGDVVARKQHGDHWGSTINAFVSAGSTVTFGVGGDGGAEWFKFMEF